MVRPRGREAISNGVRNQSRSGLLLTVLAPDNGPTSQCMLSVCVLEYIIHHTRNRDSGASSRRRHSILPERSPSRSERWPRTQYKHRWRAEMTSMKAIRLRVQLVQAGSGSTEHVTDVSKSVCIHTVRPCSQMTISTGRKRKAKCGMSTRFLALTPAFFRLHPLTITRQFDALQELLCGLSTMYSSSPYTEAWTKTKVSSLSALLVTPLLMSTRPSEQSRNSQARDRLMTSVPPDADQSGRMDTDLPDDNQVQSSEPQNGHASSSTSSSATTRPPGPIPNSAQRSDGGVTSSIVPAPSSTALLDWAMGPLATSGSDSQLLQRINGPNELDTTIGGFSSVPGANQRTELDQQHRGFGEGQAAGSTHDLSWIGPSEDPSSSSSDMLYR